MVLWLVEKLDLLVRKKVGSKDGVLVPRMADLWEF